MDIETASVYLAKSRTKFAYLVNTSEGLDSSLSAPCVAAVIYDLPILVINRIYSIDASVQPIA